MKILIIDDDPAMTELLQMMLAQTQASTYSANDGQQGLGIFNEIDPDIILLDLLMPGMDGWQVTAEIRKKSKVPILILSVIDNPGMVAKALDEGADDYLVKPVPKGVLIANINNLTRRRKLIKSDSSTLKLNIQSA